MQLVGNNMFVFELNIAIIYFLFITNLHDHYTGFWGLNKHQFPQ